MALRCRRTTHAVGDQDGVLTRHCRDCSRDHQTPYHDATVYHRWRFDAGLGRWRQLPDLIRHTPKGS